MPLPTLPDADHDNEEAKAREALFAGMGALSKMAMNIDLGLEAADKDAKDAPYIAFKRSDVVAISRMLRASAQLIDTLGLGIERGQSLARTMRRKIKPGNPA